MGEEEVIRMRCPNCGVVGRGKASYLHREITCPKCKQKVRFVRVYHIDTGKPCPSTHGKSAGDAAARKLAPAPVLVVQIIYALMAVISLVAAAGFLATSETWGTGFALAAPFAVVAIPAVFLAWCLQKRSRSAPTVAAALCILGNCIVNQPFALLKRS